ncbi:MAG: hypothetical protein IJP21_03565 [Clostridia bacterium]|nr:hypothetical protein [Clostridia bacterium]
MKKFLALVMALAMVFALAACGNTEGVEGTESNESVETIIVSSEDSTTGTSSNAPVTNTPSQNQTPAACTHKNVQTTPAVAASCSAEGKTEGKVCKDCGAVIVAPTSIPMEDHIWLAATTEKPATCKFCGATKGSVAAPQAPKAFIANPTMSVNGATLTFSIDKVEFVENNTKCNIKYSVHIETGANSGNYSWTVDVGTGDTGVKIKTDIPASAGSIGANEKYDATFETGPVDVADNYGYKLTIK